MLPLIPLSLSRCIYLDGSFWRLRPRVFAPRSIHSCAKERSAAICRANERGTITFLVWPLSARSAIVIIRPWICGVKVRDLMKCKKFRKIPFYPCLLLMPMCFAKHTCHSPSHNVSLELFSIGDLTLFSTFYLSQPIFTNPYRQNPQVW